VTFCAFFEKIELGYIVLGVNPLNPGSPNNVRLNQSKLRTGKTPPIIK